ncbi:hypothetical protein SprV_0502012300 [Sparganum proliferum]
MLHKGAPDQITANSFLADSTYRLCPSTTNLDAAVALEASEHKRKIAQLRHHFLTQLNFAVKDTVTLSTSTAFSPTDSPKEAELKAKEFEHPPSGSIFKSKSATDFRQLNSDVFRTNESSFLLGNPSLAIPNNGDGLKSETFLAKQKSLQQSEQATISGFLHLTDSTRNVTTRACRSRRNLVSNVTIKVDNNSRPSSPLKTTLCGLSVQGSDFPIYTPSNCIGTTPTRLLSGTEIPVPKPANSECRSSFCQLADSELPKLGDERVMNSGEIDRLPCHKCSPSPIQFNPAFYSSTGVLQNRHFTKHKQHKKARNHQDSYRLSADFGNTDRGPWPLGLNFEPLPMPSVKVDPQRFVDAKRPHRACTPWPVRQDQFDQEITHSFRREHRGKSISPTPRAFFPVVKDPTPENSAQSSSRRLSNRASRDPLFTENEHINPRSLLFLTESLSTNDFRRVDLSPFSSASSNNTSSSSPSSSSVCYPELSPQLLRRRQRRTRSLQGRHQRHRSRPSIREQDRLLVDSLTRRIQPLLLEGRAAEVKTLLLHALAKPSTRERALRLIGHVSDALSSSWASQKTINRSRKFACSLPSASRPAFLFYAPY